MEINVKNATISHEREQNGGDKFHKALIGDQRPLAFKYLHGIGWTTKTFKVNKLFYLFIRSFRTDISLR